MKKIGVGIIGLSPDKSWAAMAHMPALETLADDYEVVAVSTTRRESAEAAAVAYGIPHAFDSAEQLVNCDDVDLVVVTVKVPYHLELVELAAKAGKHIYCEWPLGNGLDEAKRMAASAEQAGVKAVCGMQARFSPVLAYVRDLVADGYVGEVLSSSLIGSGLAWGPVTDQNNLYLADASNGATMLTIPMGHTLDAVCLALGEFSEVRGMLINRRTSILLAETQESHPMTAPDQVLATGLLPSGAPVSVHYRGGMPQGTGLLWEINGTEGDLQITGNFGHAQSADMVLKGANGENPELAVMDVPQQYLGTVTAEGPAANITRFYQQLAKDLREGTSVCPTFDDAVRRHQLLTAIETSSATGNTEQPSAL